MVLRHPLRALVVTVVIVVIVVVLIVLGLVIWLVVRTAQLASAEVSGTGKSCTSTSDCSGGLTCRSGTCRP
jgi:hypothetical protein